MLNSGFVRRLPDSALNRPLLAPTKPTQKRPRGESSASATSLLQTLKKQKNSVQQNVAPVSCGVGSHVEKPGSSLKGNSISGVLS